MKQNPDNENKLDNRDDYDPNGFDEAEMTRLFEMYLPKLIKNANNLISNQLKSKFDADDIVISVFGTIIRRIKKGIFTFEDDAEFWRLLITIAKRKISNKVRHHKTHSRDFKKEIAETAKEILSAPEPDPAEAVVFAESLQLLLSNLSKQDQQIFLMRVESHQFKKIAAKLEVSERTVRRKMEVIKEELIKIFASENE